MKRNYNSLLIWSAALVTVVRYSAAFIASDLGTITGWLSELITIALGISGLGMGILDVIGGAALFQGWRRVMPKAGITWPMRFKILSGFVFGLILNGIIIIVPFTVSRVMSETMLGALGGGWGVWLWAIAVNVAPYMLIGGVATAGNVINTSLQEDFSNETASYGKLPETSESHNDWRYLPEFEREKIANMLTRDIQREYRVAERTARNWKVSARKYKKAAEEMLE